MYKIDILKKVCEYTGYKVTIKNNTIICKNVWGYDTEFKYNNINDALIDWLPTMEEQEEGTGSELLEQGYSNGLWKKEIQFIKERIL